MQAGILTTEGLTVRFGGVCALDQFSFAVGEKEVVGLIGPNGAGKTTLLNTISGFLHPNEGRVSFAGQSLTSLQPHAIARLGIARMFQDMRLAGTLTILENLLLACPHQLEESMCGLFLTPRKSRAEQKANAIKALELLASLGLAKERGETVRHLSYGQQKLVSIACCLARDARVLLLDEPVAGVAPRMRDQILDLIRDLPGRGKSVLLVEHDIDAVRRTCDRVIFLDSGRKVSEGSAEAVLADRRVLDSYLS